MKLFGIPYHKSKIDPSRYDKEEILKQIEYNYKLNPLRNQWNKNSRLHNANGDFLNSKFLNVKFFHLFPLYLEKIKIFFDENKFFKEQVDVKLEEANYTAMTKNNFMNYHAHPAAFVGVHYVSYDENVHRSIEFQNPNYSTHYYQFFSKEYISLLDEKNPNNFYYFEHASPNIEEDDFIIVPGTLMHRVPEFFKSSDKLRISLVVNIDILKIKDENKQE
jgi:hypothetical protein